MLKHLKKIGLISSGILGVISLGAGMSFGLVSCASGSQDSFLPASTSIDTNKVFDTTNFKIGDFAQYVSYPTINKEPILTIPSGIQKVVLNLNCFSQQDIYFHAIAIPYSVIDLAIIVDGVQIPDGVNLIPLYEIDPSIVVTNGSSFSLTAPSDHFEKISLDFKDTNLNYNNFLTSLKPCQDNSLSLKLNGVNYTNKDSSSYTNNISLDLRYFINVNNMSVDIQNMDFNNFFLPLYVSDNPNFKFNLSAQECNFNASVTTIPYVFDNNQNLNFNFTSCNFGYVSLAETCCFFPSTWFKSCNVRAIKIDSNAYLDSPGMFSLSTICRDGNTSISVPNTDLFDNYAINSWRRMFNNELFNTSFPVDGPSDPNNPIPPITMKNTTMNISIYNGYEISNTDYNDQVINFFNEYFTNVRTSSSNN